LGPFDFFTCGHFNLMNIQVSLLCGLGAKLQGPIILTPRSVPYEAYFALKRLTYGTKPSK